MKLPPFWADRPSLWFSQADSQFTISGITNDETKFHYVVSQLDTRYAAEVEDVITKPPATGRYQYLRTKLIERLSSSEEQRVRQLISEEELGDRKPSQFLRHLRSLAGTTTLQDNLLRRLWLRRLPSHVQAILTAQSELQLDKVAELANKIVEVSPAPPPLAVHAIAVPRSNADNALLAAIEGLSKQVAALSSRHCDRPRSRSRARSKSTNRTNTEQFDSSRWCWYHSRFREKATKCRAPCSVQENYSGSQQ